MAKEFTSSESFPLESFLKPFSSFHFKSMIEMIKTKQQNEDWNQG